MARVGNRQRRCVACGVTGVFRGKSGLAGSVALRAALRPAACFFRCPLPNDASPAPCVPDGWSLQEIAIEISFLDGKSIPLKVGMSDSLGTMEDAEAWQAALQQLAHEMHPVEG